MNKTCTKCKESKPLNSYHKNKRIDDNHHYVCKSCVSSIYRCRAKKKRPSYTRVPVAPLEGEIWKPVIGYEGLYEVSNKGRVKSIFRKEKTKTSYRVTQEKILKGGRHEFGYHKVILCKNGEQKHYNTHRLVAQAFIRNSNGLSHVNHIDFNTRNNNLENLEWCTSAGNTNHSALHGRIPRESAHINSSPIVQYDSGVAIKMYGSIAEAARRYNIHASGILSCCAGKYKSSGGYGWKYI